MKLSTVLVSLLLAVGLTACDKPEAKKADVAPAPAAAAPATAPAPAEAAKPAEAPALSKTESKEKDGKPVIGKDGKPEQECKTIKVRQKLEATEIPPAKK
jgi:hypothetical protein